MRIGNFVLLLTAGMFAAASLGACAGAKRAFGMEKVTPDEFTVVTKAPLVLPPDYSLRPPQPGTPSPAYIEPAASAEAALFGRDGQLSDNAQGYTGGEVSLLSTTGGSGANPDIRKVLNAETASLIEKDASIAESILFWQEPEAEAANVIDASKEAERLKGQKSGGKPAQETKTPPVKPKKKGWFDGLF